MVKETALYECLGVEVTCDENQLKRSYRKLALKYHPDKNAGDEQAAEMFKKIGHAYEILSDSEKRAVYDKHGMKGLEQGGGGEGHDASDIFSMFFGGGAPRGERKPKDIIHELAVSLEDMYLGKAKKIALLRDRFCEACNAEGVKPGAQRSPCNDCGGRGVRIVMQQVFPGMVQRGQAPCPSCEGTGQRVRPSDVCSACQGRKTTKERKIVEVHIEKGMKKGDHIRFTGDGDQVPGIKLSGDVLLVIGQKPHDLFTRVGSHLLLNQTISLQEALCGFELPIKHLDKRVIVVKVPPGKVVDPNFAWTINREGMPVPNTGGVERGNLVIHFNVEFPTGPLPIESRAAVAEALEYEPHDGKFGASASHHTLSDYNPQPKRKSRGGRGPQRAMYAQDDDDDDDGPRGGAQCQQQ